MFYKILNNIKINNKNNKNYFFISLKKNELNFIKKLIKINIIKFIIKYDNKYIIYLNFFKKNKIIFKIKNLYKLSNFKNIKIKEIKKINKKNKILLISSNKNIITNFESEKLKIGGIILFYVWN